MRRTLLLVPWLLAATACERGTEQSGAGGLALIITSGPGSGAALDSGRVHIEGRTPLTLKVTPGDSVEVPDLQPGGYTVSLEGFIGSEVERFGRVTGVQVVAGQTVRPVIPFNSFVPVVAPIGLTADGTQLNISFSAVPAAVDYRIKIDHFADFSAATEVTLTGTSILTPAITAEPARFVVVRATDPYGAIGRPSDTAEAQVTVITSDPSLDGVVGSDGARGTASGPTGWPAIGDFDASWGNGVGWRQFYSFDLSPVLSSVGIDAAVLRLFQATTSGSPYANFGPVLVDHLDYGTSLDADDYSVLQADQNQSDLGPLSVDPVAEYKFLDVTSLVQADKVLGRLRSQYRLHFSGPESNSDGVDDNAVFTDGEDSFAAGAVPQLVVVSH